MFSCFKSNLKFPPKVTGLAWTWVEEPTDKAAEGKITFSSKACRLERGARLLFFKWLADIHNK